MSLCPSAWVVITAFFFHKKCLFFFLGIFALNPRLEVLEVLDVDGPGRDGEDGLVLLVLLELRGVPGGADLGHQRSRDLLLGGCKGFSVRGK